MNKTENMNKKEKAKALMTVTRRNEVLGAFTYGRYCGELDGFKNAIESIRELADILEERTEILKHEIDHFTDDLTESSKEVID